VGALKLTGGQRDASVRATTYVARRGTLPIMIVEGGSVESLKPCNVKCEVKGGETKILSIIEEGYRITQEDIVRRKILVQLDSSSIEDVISKQEISYQNAKAAAAKAQQDYEIQVKENESNIQAAERDVRFQAMDFQKYLGDELARELMDELHRRRSAEAAAEEALDAVDLFEKAQQTVNEKRALVQALDAVRASSAEESDRRNRESLQPADRPRARGTREDTPQAPEGASSADNETAPAPAAPADSSPPASPAVPGDSSATSESPRPLDALGNGLADALERGPEALAQDLAEAEAALALAQIERDGRIAEFVQTAKTAGVAEPDCETLGLSFPPVDFARLVDDPRVGGEAAQKRRQLETDILLEDEERITAEDTLEGTRRLFEHDFVTETELKRDEMAVKRREISVEAKNISKELFFRYQFPKEAEQAFSNYEESLRKLDRVMQETATKLMSAEVNLDSAEARLRVEEKERAEGLEQLTKCTIYATHEGIVVYGGAEDRYYRGDPIAEGTTVHENQTILMIPDITSMAVRVKVHESAIQQIRPSQSATIRVEAYPEQTLHGEVNKVSVVPSSQNRWLNPDLMVYDTVVAIEGIYEWLKPGMTAQVEISVATLENAIYVPLQAVSSVGDERVVYLAHGERRTVETGMFNDTYIEIKKGLDDGDEVLLRSIESTEEKETAEEPAADTPASTSDESSKTSEP